MMSTDAAVERPVTVPPLTHDNDEVAKDAVALSGAAAASGVDTAAATTSLRWHTSLAAADEGEHQCAQKAGVILQQQQQQHGGGGGAASLYGRLGELEAAAAACSYDYSGYSPPHYVAGATRYPPSFHQHVGPPSSSYVMPPYGPPPPYSPAAYAFSLAAPCAGTAGPGYMPHHLTPPPPPPAAALLAPERPAPGYRFNATSTSLLQPRTSRLLRRVSCRVSDELSFSANPSHHNPPFLLLD